MSTAVVPMMEFRCTRRDLYRNLKGDAATDLGRRNGNYVRAVDVDAALRHMQEKYPYDRSFDIQYWKDEDGRPHPQQGELAN